MRIEFEGEVVCDECGAKVKAKLAIEMRRHGLVLMPPTETTARCFNSALGAVAYCSSECEGKAIEDSIKRA